MIPRYNVPEIEAIWSDQNRFNRFLVVELALLETLEEFNKIPKETSKHFKHVTIDPKRISEIEEITRHDVIAFCTSITEQVDQIHARFFHFGVTSSDILDSALSLQIKDSLHIIVSDLEKLILALNNKINETSDLLTIGRSHGMFAEPMVFGQKFLSFEQEFSRRLHDYKNYLAHELTGQLSGAVGNYTILTSEIETRALEKIGLRPEPVSTQVIPRDHVAKLVSIGSLCAAAMERLATEIRLLHHSDVGEVSEGFKKGQKGSSTMPHKKNPISSENISGLARIIKSHFDVAIQNCVLWHERDISHSSAERMILPDHFGLLSYTLRRCTSIIQNLEIHKDKIESKITNSFSFLSSYILHEMILINETSRENLYALIQESSFSSATTDDFFNQIKAKCEKENLNFPQSISIEKLKSHYINEFKKIRNRTQN